MHSRQKPQPWRQDTKGNRKCNWTGRYIEQWWDRNRFWGLQWPGSNLATWRVTKTSTRGANGNDPRTWRTGLKHELWWNWKKGWMKSASDKGENPQLQHKNLQLNIYSFMWHQNCQESSRNERRKKSQHSGNVKNLSSMLRARSTCESNLHS